ncbi:MAG: hypothetical protein LCH68_00240 [Proteobacteria bacterium]|nr:hypothetical protein [Pseudomonadota bacterium]
MVTKQYRFACTLLMATALSACQQNQPSQTQEQTAPVAATPQSEPSVAPQVSPANVTFTVTPDAIKQCPGAEPVSTEVSWLVADMAVTEVKVEVANAGQSSRKLLSLAGRQGKATTEAWVVVGTKFYLTDSKTGQELASFEMPSQPCN